MAQFPLRIVFDGVIAIGPACPPAGESLPGPLFGVMARSTRQRSAKSRREGTEPPSYIPIHYPTLFTQLQPAEGARPTDEVYRMWNLWHPVRERLEFAFDGVGLPGTLTYKRPTPEGEGLLEDAAAVPNMREVWPERCHIRSEFLEPRPTADVAAQVFVPFGEVSGSGDETKRFGADVHFIPSRGPKLLRKSIVPHVVVTVMTERVKISSYSLDTGEELDPLEFVLTEPAEIRISNGDPSDMLTNMQRLSDAQLDLGVAPTDEEAVDSQRRDLTPVAELLDGFKTGGFPRSRAELERIARSMANAVHGTSSPFPRTGTFGSIFPEPRGSRPASARTGGFNDPTPNSQVTQEVVSDPNRDSDVDLDFELYYTLVERIDEREGEELLLPIPKRVQGNFDTRNCFVCMVDCHERPVLISERQQEP